MKVARRFFLCFLRNGLRIDPADRRKNTSNHNIDLCQIYGRTEQAANLLRTKTGGKLTSQTINGEEYLDYLGETGDDGQWKVKDHYKINDDGEGLPYTSEIILSAVFTKWPDESDTDFKKRKEKFYATGLERGNSSVGYVAISTLFMREHNRICDELSVRYSDWADDDERLFQTARMINLAKIIGAASIQRAGKISLKNVPKFLLGAEYQTIKMGRDFRLRSYNEYRKLFKLNALTSFNELTDDEDLRKELKDLYVEIDNVELIVSLFAQKHGKGGLFGDLLTAMVAYDAFTQIYTNPLLSTNVYNADTFSEYGLELIYNTNSVQDLADRNISNGAKIKAGFSL